MERIKSSFQKKGFIPAAIGVLTVSTVFIVLQKINPPVDAVLLNRIIKAPIDDAFKALKVDYSEAVRRLETNGISIGGATTIESIWINNNADPEKVTDLIMEQE